jgi:2-haloacid dehalogenase
VLHVSSSYRYDHMTAHDMRVGMQAFVNRGHDPLIPYYGAVEIADIGGLPGLVGL